MVIIYTSKCKKKGKKGNEVLTQPGTLFPSACAEICSLIYRCFKALLAVTSCVLPLNLSQNGAVSLIDCTLMEEPEGAEDECELF